MTSKIVKKKLAPNVIATPEWVDDSYDAEEGGFYRSSVLIAGKKIKVQVFKEKPKYADGFGIEARELESQDGSRYWCVPLGQFVCWPDTDLENI